MRVGRGRDEIEQLGSWAGAVTPKPPVNAEKAKCYRPTDQPTDKLTDKAGWRVTCTRLKIGEAFLFMAKPAVIPFFQPCGMKPVIFAYKQDRLFSVKYDYLAELSRNKRNRKVLQTR